MSNLMKNIFVATNVLFSAVVISLCLASWAGAFKPPYHDLKELCENYELRTASVPKVSYIKDITMGFCAFNVFLVISLIRNNFKPGNTSNIFSAVSWESWIVLLNFNLLYLLIEFIKCTVGKPVPYFFANNDLQQSICLKNNDSVLIINIDATNMNLRKSFPSFRCAIWTYCSTVIYLYLAHWDHRGTFHSARQVFLLGMATASFAIYNGMYNNMEHYLSDIWVGALLGIVQAAVTIRDIFGTFFHSPSLPKNNTRRASNSIPLQEMNQRPEPNVEQPIPVEDNSCFAPLSTIYEYYYY